VELDGIGENPHIASSDHCASRRHGSAVLTALISASQQQTHS